MFTFVSAERSSINSSRRAFLFTKRVLSCPHKSAGRSDCGGENLKKLHPRDATMDKHLMPGSRSGSQAQEPKPSSEPVWDVQDILAERTSLMGENEELVVWKPSWEPIRNVRADGPAMNRLRASRFLGVALGYAAGFKSSATSG